MVTGYVTISCDHKARLKYGLDKVRFLCIHGPSCQAPRLYGCPRPPGLISTLPLLQCPVHPAPPGGFCTPPGLFLKFPQTSSWLSPSLTSVVAYVCTCSQLPAAQRVSSDSLVLPPPVCTSWSLLFPAPAVVSSSYCLTELANK